MMAGNKLPKQAGVLQGIAARDIAQGQRLENYMQTGTLPPSMQAGIDAATTSAVAAIRSRNANAGTSGSSAELQEINAVKIQAAGEAQGLALNLFDKGVSQTQLGTGIYNDLMNATITQDSNFSTALGNMTAAMASLGRPYSPYMPGGAYGSGATGAA
jgi:hypothetical protein